MPPPARVRQKEIRALLASISVIRILKYAADQSLQAVELRKRLHDHGMPLDTAALNCTLARMRRQGWLRIKNDVYSITPRGRGTLKDALSHLIDLFQLLGG